MRPPHPAPPSSPRSVHDPQGQRLIIHAALNAASTPRFIEPFVRASVATPARSEGDTGSTRGHGAVNSDLVHRKNIPVTGPAADPGANAFYPGSAIVDTDNTSGFGTRYSRDPVIDGKVVATATGNNSRTVQGTNWDTGAFQGQQTQIQVVNGTRALGVSGQQLEIEARLRAGTASRFGLNVRTGNGQYTQIGYDTTNGTLFVDRSHSGDASFSSSFAADSVRTAPLAWIGAGA